MKSLKAKLYAGFIIINAITLMLSGILYLKIGEIPHQFERVVTKDVSLYHDTNDMKLLLSKEIIVLQSYLIHKDPSVKDKMFDLQKQVNTLEKKIGSTQLEKDEVEMFEDAQKKTKDWNTFVNKLDFTKTLSHKEEQTLSAYITSNYKMVSEKSINAWETLGNHAQNVFNDDTHKITIYLDDILRNHLIFILLSILIIMFIALFITDKMTKPIKKIKAYIEQLGEGHIHIDPLVLNTKDEFGDLAISINSMRGNLGQIVKDLKDTQNQLSMSAEQMLRNAEKTDKLSKDVSHKIKDVAQLNESQAQRLTEVTIAMGEMSLGVQQIALNSTVVRHVSNEVSHEVEDGNRMIQQSVAQIQKVYDTVQKSAEVVENLGTISKEIEQIVEVIKSYTEETHLLSLNAQIESAHAGPYGKSFEVVANRIKTLAEESKKSTYQINELVKGVHKQINHAIKSIEIGKKEAEIGNELVCVAGKTFDKISNSIKDVNAQIDEVSASVSQISAVSEQVTGSVENMELGAKTITSHAKEVALSSDSQTVQVNELRSSTENLNGLSSRINEVVKQFR